LSDFFVHPLSDVQTQSIGHSTRIWQFVIVLPKAVLGHHCNICSHCFIENDVVVGNHVTIKSGVQLWDGLTVEDHVFIGPNVTFTNDKFPVSGNKNFTRYQTTIKKHASIGGGATILPNIHIGEYALVGAGAVVTKDVPAYAIVIGNPATVVGYNPIRDEQKA